MSFKLKILYFFALKSDIELCFLLTQIEERCAYSSESLRKNNAKNNDKDSTPWTFGLQLEISYSQH